MRLRITKELPARLEGFELEKYRVNRYTRSATRSQKCSLPTSTRFPRMSAGCL